MMKDAQDEMLIRILRVKTRYKGTKMNKAHSKKRLCLLGTFIVFTSSTIRTDGLLESAQKILGTALSFPLGHNTASQETTDYVNDITKQLNPDQKAVQVKKMNRFAQYLFGSQNALALPGLNTVLVNEDWFKKLPEEQKRFLIGRSLVHMNKPLEYALYKYALPLLTKSFIELNAPFALSRVASAEEKADMDDEERTYFDSKVNRWALRTALNLLASLTNQYFSRRLEYEADKEAALKLNCIDGAVDLLKRTDKFPSQDPLGALCSTIPLLHIATGSTMPLLDIPTGIGQAIHNKNVANRALNNADIEGEPTKLGRQEIINTALEEDHERLTVKLGRLPLGQLYLFKLPVTLRDAIPGRFNNISTRLESFLLSLPLVRYFWSYPRPIDRIKALKALERVLEKEQTKSA